MLGVVLSVDNFPAGDELNAAVTTGAGTVTLVNPLDFVLTGGQVTIDGNVYNYTGIDPSTYVMTLSTTLLVDSDAGTRVNVYPDVIEKWATVEIQADNDAVFALVPHALWDRLDEGVRDPSAQESVEVGQPNGDWLILDVLAEVPTVNGEFIDPTTVPTDPLVDDKLDKLRADVTAQGGSIDTNTGDIENVSATAYDAGSLASIANISVALSDYEPSAGDITYYARNPAGALLRGTTFNITNKALTSNVATLTFDGGLTSTVGQYIVVTGVGAPFDGTWLITAINTTLSTVSYACTSANVTSVAVSPAGTGFNSIIVSRDDGSMWLTRTRARRNFVNNPSFEVDVIGWSAIQTVMLREASAAFISGSYTCKLTNSGVSGNHSVSADNGGGASRVVVTPGQIYTGSCYALAVSGTNNGVYCQFDFYTSAGTFIQTISSVNLDANGAPYGGTVNATTGAAMAALDTVQWARTYLTAPAPATAGLVVFSVISPTGNESAVWRVDGADVEADDLLGRYFDGRSYAGSWSGIADSSPSILAGGRVSKVFELDNGGWVQRWFSGTALVDIDLGAVSTTSATLAGTFLTDNTIPIDKFAGTPIVAGATLAAGDLVNVYNVGGLFRMQKADAGVALLPAHAFVLQAVTSGSVGYAYSAGYNPYVSGLTPGPQFLSNVPGKCAGSPPATVGSLIQPVGFAGGAIVLNFTPGQPIYIV